jgi:hypothetical protein
MYLDISFSRRDVSTYILSKRDVCRYNPEDKLNAIHQPRSSLLNIKSLPVLLERKPNEQVIMLNTGCPKKNYTLFDFM